MSRGAEGMNRPIRPAMKAVVVALATALTAVFLVACTGLRDLEAPDVVVTAIRPLDATLLEQRFEVDLRIYNPNNRDLNIDGVDFELVVNDSRLARGSGATELLLPRLGEAETTVRVSTTVFDVARQMMNAGESGVISYRLSGRVHLGNGLGGSLPFERSGVLESNRRSL
jgi:LEA14-like dessication related protein